MKNIKKMETGALVEMLAICTTDYLKMLKEGVPEEEYYERKTKIMELQREIKSRQPPASNESVPGRSVDIVESQ